MFSLKLKLKFLESKVVKLERFFPTFLTHGTILVWNFTLKLNIFQNKPTFFPKSFIFEQFYNFLPEFGFPGKNSILKFDCCINI